MLLCRVTPDWRLSRSHFSSAMVKLRMAQASDVRVSTWRVTRKTTCIRGYWIPIVAVVRFNALECDDRMNRATFQNSTPIINNPAKKA
jgi:hypothetical protein